MQTCHPYLTSRTVDGSCPICPGCTPRATEVIEATPNPDPEIEPEVDEPFDPVDAHRQVRAERCRRSLAEFFKRSWHVLEPDTPLVWNWHLDVLCDHIQRMLEDWAHKVADQSYEMAIQNLAINVPPGTAKSRILSVCAPAWAWLRWPGLRILCLSANPTVSIRDSVYCRQLLESNWYQDTFEPGWTFSEDQNAKGHFNNTRGGERIAKGIGATITGQRGHVIFCDDLNDVKEAHSDKKRRSINRDFDGAVYNRVADMRSAIRISIQQRVHEDDFTGHVLKKGNWAHLCLPMEYEAKRACKCGSCVDVANDNKPKPNEYGFIDPRTIEVDVLHPERFPPEVIADMKVSLGSYDYAGQCQQRPAPADGGMFKWKNWRFWKPDGVAAEDKHPRPEKCYKGSARALPARFDEIIISADCAFKDKPTSDRVAVFVIGRLGADRFIIDRRCDRYDFGRTKGVIVELSKLYPLAMRKIIEDAANGPAVINDLKSEIPGILGVTPQGGKTARAFVLSPSVEAGNWYVPEGAPWLEDFCHEFGIFPNGANDDQVDAISQAAIEWQTSPDAMRAGMLGTW